MKLVIKSCKSRQLHTGASLPALTTPCGREQISQCQRRKKLVNSQRTESVNIAKEQSPLDCSKYFRHRGCGAEAEKTIAAAPPKGGRCFKARLSVVRGSTSRQLVLELSWPQPNGQPDAPNQITSAAFRPSMIGCILILPWWLSSPSLTEVPSHPPYPARAHAPPNYLFLSRHLAAAELLQPWARPHGRGTQLILRATTVP